MSPEVFISDDVSPALDVYSLGVLCECTLLFCRPRVHGGGAAPLLVCLLRQLPLRAAPVRP